MSLARSPLAFCLKRITGTAHLMSQAFLGYGMETRRWPSSSSNVVRVVP